VKEPTSKQKRALDSKLKALPTMDRRELVAEFQGAYGKEPPKWLSNRILSLAVAYRLQEKVYGGLKPEIRRMLLTASATAPEKASAGTVLIREWHGKQHTVTVHADRVGYGGRLYRSLTEVASLITGHKRSGPAFFGLRAKTDG
jgi:hypothetical protein